MNIRMGQINSGFSWNTAPGGFNPYMPVRQAAIPNTFGGLPAPGAGVAPAASDCYTCTNPTTGDTQYGVPSAKATQLKATGYRCRKDDCAGGLGPEQLARYSDAAQNIARGISDLFRGGATAPDVTGYSPAGSTSQLMGGARRIPIVGGLGRRALS